MRQISSALMLASLARTALSYGAPKLKKRLKTHPLGTGGAYGGTDAYWHGIRYNKHLYPN